MTNRRWFHPAQQDFRYALRTLRRNWGFALTVVATFAVGIGATTAMLTLVHTVLIQPLPYPSSDRIVFVRTADNGISAPDFLDYRAAESVRHSFEAVATWGGSSTVISDGQKSEQLFSLDVTPTFFAVLGLQPAAGRFLLEGDPQASAVLSHDLWTRRFGGDPTIVGRTITLDGHATIVVGVAPTLADPSFNGDIFRPFDFRAPHATVRAYHTGPVIGRLRAGITTLAAQHAMGLVAAGLAAAHREDANQRVMVEPYLNMVVGNAKAQLLTLLAAVVLVFGIACANIASLTVARGATREGELSTRIALGASRMRLIQQLIIESVLLSLVGGALGMGLAVAMLRIVRATSTLPRLDEIQLGGMTWVYAAVLSFIGGILVGAVSAGHASRTALQGSLSVGGRSTSSRRTTRRREFVVVLQLTGSLVLVSGAGILLQSFARISRVNPGFDPDGMVVTSIAVPFGRYSPAAAEHFWADLLLELRALPQILSVTAASQLPLMPGGDATYGIAGQPVSPLVTLPSARMDVIADDYFRTLRIPLVAGKSFDVTGLTNDEMSIVVSSSVARARFPFESAVGKRLTFPDFGGWSALIVGVAADVRTDGLNAPSGDVVYLPLHRLHGWADELRLVVRTHGDPGIVTSSIRRVLSRRDPLLTLGKVRTMSEIIGRSTARKQLETTVLTAFACCGLLLAALGLYGLLAYSVTTRRDEFAIRYALGSQTSQLFSLVLSKGMKLVAAGLGVGLLALPVAFGVIGRVFDVTQVEPAIVLATTMILAVIGLGACVGPGIQAVRLGSRWVRDE